MARKVTDVGSKAGMALRDDLDLPAEGPGTPARWFMLALLALAYFTLYLHRSLLGYLQPPLRADLHLNDEQLGWLRWGIKHRYFKGVELQADCYAGLFSRYAAQQKLLESGDLAEALRLMTTVGDRARLSPTAEGAHGTPKQRRAWFMRGYKTGRIATCNGVYKALY